MYWDVKNLIVDLAPDRSVTHNLAIQVAQPGSDTIEAD